MGKRRRRRGVFHVESLLHRVVEMVMEARKASLQMRRDIASTRVAIAPGGGVNAPGGGGGEPAPTEEPKPKELNGDEWRVLVSGMLEGQLGSLPDVTVWPIDADLKVTCEGLSGPRPRLAQLTELQLPRLGMESSAGAHVAATKNKVYNHDRAYSAEDELDMFEDYCRTIAWGASQHAKEGGERRTCKKCRPQTYIYISSPFQP